MSFNFGAVSDILACPQCRGELICIGDSLICNSSDQRLRFPIVDGIPRLLLEESSPLSDEQWDELKKQQGITA
jgi:uncharacterized protein YbaR (Trm112 family)|tara:strand:+ start:207 stop:425 length:219 start_codon:yes stop_codon:yes gene_type:complete